MTDRDRQTDRQRQRKTDRDGIRAKDGKNWTKDRPRADLITDGDTYTAAITRISQITTHNPSSDSPQQDVLSSATHSGTSIHCQPKEGNLFLYRLHPAQKQLGKRRVAGPGSQR